MYKNKRTNSSYTTLQQFINFKFFLKQALRQLVIVFDVKIARDSNGYRTAGSLAILHSTASTYIHTNSSDIEVEEITVK